MLWLWLSYRFEEESFPGRARAERIAAAICDLLDKGLERVTRASKRGVDVSLEVRFPFPYAHMKNTRIVFVSCFELE
jgi:hypothetical protein